MDKVNKTLGERTAEDLLRFIQETPCKPGDKLPTEAVLSGMLGVGRNTVREAIRALVSRNILVVRQGAGTFVSDKQGIADDPLGFSMTDDKRKLTRDLLQVRVMLEPEIAALAAQNAGEADIAALEACLKEAEQLIKARGDYTEADMAFHRQIACCSHNEVMSTLIPVITRGVDMFASTVSEPEYEQTLKAHRNIFEAIKNHQSVEAKQYMVFHLLYNHNRY